MRKYKLFLGSVLLAMGMMGCTPNQQISDSGGSKNPSMEVTQIPEDQKDKEQEDTQDVEEPYKTITTDVVFFNALTTHTKAFVYDDRSFVYMQPEGCPYYFSDYSRDLRQAYCYYEAGLYDENQLFAFAVRLGNFLGELPERLPEESDDDYELRKEEFLKDSYMQTFKEYNIYMIEDYPFSQEVLSTMPSYGPAFEGTVEAEECAFARGIMQCSCFHAQFAVAGTLQDIQALCEDEDITNEWCFRLISAPRPDTIEWLKNAGYELDFSTLHIMYETYRKPVLGDEWYGTCNTNLFQKN